MKTALKALLAFLLLHAVLLAALVAVQNLDQGRMRESIKRSVDYGTITPNNHPHGLFDNTVDMFTDCIALSSAITPRSAASALERAVRHEYIYSTEPGKTDPCGSLTQYLANGTPVLTEGYVRFWHGYDIYLRPLLRAGLSPLAIRKLDLAIVTVLAFTFAWLLTRTYPSLVPMVLMATLVLTTDLASAAAATTHTVGPVVALLTGISALLRLENHAHPAVGLRWMALYSGALLSFFDFLFNTPFTPALLAFLLIAHDDWRQDGAAFQWRESVKNAAVVVFIWFAAYACSWILKWVVAAMVLDPQSVFKEVVGQILFRVNGAVKLDEAQARTALHFGDATLANIRSLGAGWFALVLALTAGILADTAWRFGHALGHLKHFAVLASPACIPLVWLEILRNHSVIHSWLVYRSLGLSLAIVLTAATLVRLRAAREYPRADHLGSRKILATGVMGKRVTGT